MILAFKLTLRKSFPTPTHSLHFALGVKSSNLPWWITSWSKPTCMHTATAIFLLFLLAEKMFRPSLASFYCRAIIIFPKKDHYWPNCEDLGVPIVSKAMTQTIDSWEEMALATFYERVERDCSCGMADPLQDRWVSEVTSRLPTGDCNLCAEDVHGQPFASWRWTAGQPAWWCQVWWRRP